MTEAGGGMARRRLGRGEECLTQVREKHPKRFAPASGWIAQMLLVIAIIAIVWLGFALMGLALCRAAAMADRNAAIEAVSLTAPEPSTTVPPRLSTAS